MGQVLPLPLPLDARTGAPGFQALIDQLQVGMAWFDAQGTLLLQNEAAETFFGSGAGERIRASVGRLLEASVRSDALVQSSVELSTNERLHVSVARDRMPGAWLVVLDRQKLERARAEAGVLRSVLKALAHSVSRKDAARRALEAVRSQVPFEHLAFFELTPAGTHFTCAASLGVSDVALAGFVPIALEPRDSLLSVAWTHQRVVNVGDLAMAPGTLPFEERPGLAAVLLPIGGKRPAGVLYASAWPDVLGDTALGLLQALGDALGAVLELALLEAEAARAREIAAQRDRLATIGQLVAGVAHEINNPLAFLKSNLNSLKGDLEDLQGKPNAELWKDVEDIVDESMQGVTRIEQIVQALKGTARQRSEKVRFEPARAVSEAVTIFRGARKSECDLDCQIAALPEVVGSPSGLGQVVLNLLQNGLDAMGAIERKARRLEVSGRTVGDRVVFAFVDHGTGIPDEVQRRMYDAFYTTKEPGKGTGLGLYICQEIVEGMGGRIEFTTSARGTTFEISLPIAPDA